MGIAIDMSSLCESAVNILAMLINTPTIFTITLLMFITMSVHCSVRLVNITTMWNKVIQ